jgi:hypothetical protein
MLKLTYKGHFLTLKKTWKILVLKIQMVCTCFGAPSTHGSFFFEKNQNLNFWWNFKVSWTNCLWEDFGSFGQILLHWQWLTACPNFTWNLKNLITFEPWVQTLRVASHWKATNRLYLHFKFQVHRKIIASALAACSKQQKEVLSSIDV